MADIKINGATPSAFYDGSTAATAVYYGSTKLWEATPQQQGVTIGGKFYPTVTIACSGTYPDFDTVYGYEFITTNLDYAWDGLDVKTSGTLSSDPSACYYNFDESTYGWNGAKTGLLYNKAAVQYLLDNRSTLLPSSIGYWTLIPYSIWDNLCRIGGSKSTAEQGGVGLSSVDWVVPSSGYPVPTNATGFNAIPSGVISSTGTFNFGYNQMTTSTNAYLTTWLDTVSGSNRHTATVYGNRNTSRSSSSVDSKVGCSIRLCRYKKLPTT